MGTIYKLKRVSFSMYDETDALKRMKDSDILAEQKKSSPGYGGVLSSAASGAIIGGTAGLAAGAMKGLGTKGARIASAGAKAAKYGKWGAVLGGVGMGVAAMNKRNKQAEETNFYNKRLKYAQRQAQRREKADWKSNMTQREGYSF